MKNPRAILMIVVAIIIGIGAVILASKWVSKKTSIATNQIAVATGDTDMGSQLSADKIKLTDWPAGNIPEGAIKDLKSLEGRVVKFRFRRGEPILEAKLAPVGSKAGLSAAISTGNRAMTVRVNDVVGVAGFALPGNYVDIVVNTEDDNIKSDGRKSRSVSKIVLEHILVLAVAQETKSDENKPKVVSAVTLEVTPDQVEKLDLARSVGTLSLVLRSQMDVTPLKTRGATKPSLLFRSEEPAMVAPKPDDQKTDAKKEQVQPERKAPTGRQIEVIRGTQRSSQDY